jgi:hypothetical protein
MAKPTPMYQGNAPQAMSMMGQGVVEGMSRASELYAKGMQSAGSSVAGGITSAAGSYVDAQNVNKTADAVRKFAATMPDVKTEGSMGYMLNQFLQDPDLSNAQVAQFGTSAVSDYIKNMFEMSRIREMNKGRFAVAGLRAGAGGGDAGMEPLAVGGFENISTATPQSGAPAAANPFGTPYNLNLRTR